MTTLTVTAKNQVTLKRDVVKHLGVAQGQKVVVEMLPHGVVQLRAAPTGKISDAFGILKPPPGVHFTLEEIEEAIQKGWAGER